jgi:hypothetical protein
MKNPQATRRPARPLTALIAVASAAALLVLSGPGAGHAATEHEHLTAHTRSATVPVHTTTAIRFHDDMRKLWEDHITWTRLAIVSFAAGVPDFDATAARLLRNQDDIGNAVHHHRRRSKPSPDHSAWGGADVHARLPDRLRRGGRD